MGLFLFVYGGICDGIETWVCEPIEPDMHPI